MWFIVFIRPNKTEERFFHSHVTVNTMKVLADEYQGKVRFAWVDILQEECLKESFAVRSVPQNFLIVPDEGRVYEMQALSMAYYIMHQFIEGGYKNESMVYQSFSIPFIYPEWSLPLRYVYNYIFTNYHRHVKLNLAYTMRKVIFPRRWFQK